MSGGGGGGAAASKYVVGHEYDLDGNGTLGVWNGAKFLDPDAYVASQGMGQKDFDTHRALMGRLDQAGQDAQQWDATGFAAKEEVKHGLGGTAGYNLNTYLQPIRSNEFIRGLQDIKAQSPAGGGIGHPTGAQTGALESRNAVLDVGQGREQFLGELRAMKDAYGRAVPGLTQNNPIDFAKVNPDTIPQGAYFRAPDGKVYVNRKGAGPAGARPAPAPQAPAPAAPQAAPRTQGGGLNGKTVSTAFQPQSEADYNAIPPNSYYIHPTRGLSFKR